MMKRWVMYMSVLGLGALNGSCNEIFGHEFADPMPPGYCDTKIAPTCPEGQRCDLAQNRCVTAENPDVKVKLITVTSPFAMVDNIRINNQSCSIDKTCEITLPKNSDIEVTFTPSAVSRWASLRNAQNELTACENNRCKLRVKDQDQTLTLKIVNSTFCSRDNWCQMYPNLNLKKVWLPDNNKIYALGNQGSILNPYYSTIVASKDGGQSWSKYPVDDIQGVTDLYASADGELLCAVIQESKKIVCSKDGGQSWSTKVEMRDGLRSIAGSSDGKTMCAVGWSGQILCSPNGGTSWWPKASGTLADLRSIFSTKDGKILCAVGTSGAIFCSKDSGAKWAPQSSGTGKNLLDIKGSPDGKFICASGDNGTLVCSKDSAANWAVQTTGGASGVFSNIASSADGNKWCAVGQLGANLCSSDGGTSWWPHLNLTTQNLNYVNRTLDDQRFCTVGDKGTVFCTPQDGIIAWLPQSLGTTENLYHISSSTDGQTLCAAGDNSTLVCSKNSGKSWGTVRLSGSTNMVQAIPKILNTKMVCAIIGIDEGMGNYKQNIKCSSDGAQTWSPFLLKANLLLTSIFGSSDGQKWCAVGPNGFILCSIDSGQSWVQKTSGISSDLNDIFASKDGQHWCAVGAQSKIPCSADGGQSWFTQPAGVSIQYKSIFGSQDGQKFCAVGEAGFISCSTDGGQTWFLRKSGTDSEFISISGSQDGQYFCATAKQGNVICSTDAGQTWVSKKSEILKNRTLGQIVSNTDGQKLYALGANGQNMMILYSEDQGQNWSESQPIPSIVFSIGIRPDDQQVCAAGMGGTFLCQYR